MKPGNWLTLQVHPKPGQFFDIITHRMASECWVFDNNVFIDCHVFNCTGDGVRSGPPDVDTLDHIVLTQTKVQGRGSMGQVGVAKLYFPDLIDPDAVLTVTRAPMASRFCSMPTRSIPMK